MAWRVTIRIGPKVTKHPAPSVEEAVAILERELTGAGARRDELRALTRTYTPQQQVAARGEVRTGPPWAPVQGGIDVRGDGSMEAYTGRVTRQVVEERNGESPFAALLRALS
ncbi:MAG: hypothetical protein ACSLFR_05835 [Solirubrobacteraceae bacterium]